MENVTQADRRPTVLIVDDTPDNVAVLSSVLKGTYRTRIATSGEKALELAARDGGPDLILLDIMMPGMDGCEVCRRLKQAPGTTDIPVIFLTARAEAEDERRGLELGAVDHITRPLSPAIVMARIGTHLHLKNVRDFLRDRSDYLEKEVVRRTREVGTIQDVAMVAMGSLAETRDNETGNHIRRTQHYVKELALAMADHPRFRDTLTPGTIELLYKSAPLHDIGKVGIPDSILLKPGQLTADEFAVMKTHTTLGNNALIAAEKVLDTPTSFLRIAREIAWSHHERWDGNGYPRGLSGDDTPASGRLMAVADVYDALISRRVYKPAFGHEKAVSVIREGSGVHFDSDVVDAFVAISDRFKEVAQAYGDRDGAEA